MGVGEHQGKEQRESAPLSLRYPRALLAVALALIAVLAVLGHGVDEKLRPTSLDVPGTESAKANSLLHRYFGDSAPFAILLQDKNTWSLVIFRRIFHHHGVFDPSDDIPNQDTIGG